MSSGQPKSKKPKGPYLVVEKRTWQVQPGSPYESLDAARDALAQREQHDGRVGEDTQYAIYGQVAWGS